MALTEDDLDAYEWKEERRSYREWLVPAELANAHAVTDGLEIEEEPSWANTPDSRGLLASSAEDEV